MAFGLDLAEVELKEQGHCAAANLLSLGSASYKEPLLVRDFGIKVCDGFYGGTIRLQDGGCEHMKFDGPTNIYKKIYLLNDLLEGAVWFNCFTDKPRVEQALVEKSFLSGNEDAFL